MAHVVGGYDKFVMGVSALFLATGFTRVLRVFNAPGARKKDSLKRLNRTSWLYIGLMLIMLWLMVQKPTFWQISSEKILDRKRCTSNWCTSFF